MLPACATPCSGAAPAEPPPQSLAGPFAGALADFDACRYARLTVSLPLLVRAGHVLALSGRDTDQYALPAKVYLLATRMLVKLDETPLGWIAADRARQFANAADDALAVAEAARQAAVLARRAGRHNEALSLPPRTSPTCAASAGPAPRCAASWSRAPRTRSRAAVTVCS
ncbi:hypothetical protein [Streptomyces sp. NPDC057386]|uniref:hypothetical protein n=1 Tax=unclassified Streptomyces TaxID=2593676 RepID=UPI0036270460